MSGFAYVLGNFHFGFAYVLGKFYFGFAYVLGKSCIFAIQINDITIMIHRLLIEDLAEWGKRKNRKPLVLRGARQVGKTTLIDEFSKQYDCYIKLNLEQSSDAKAFGISDNVAEIFQYICLQKKIVADKSKRTLLFIDEIQNEPKAVGLLRYFYEEMPWLHIVAAGSRLQTLIKQRISFPVGRVEYMSLRPCSFLEFLNATANEPLAEMIRQLNVSPIYHDMLIALFNKYTLVGGMPEALVEYATNEDVSRLSPIYRSLLNGYNEDVEKYAKNANQVNVIRHLLTHGWTEAGQTITFNRFGGSNYTSKEVHEALEVLQNAFLLSLDYPITTVKAPAIPALTRQPKLIWLDSGIMNFSVDIQTEYLQNSSLLDVWKGHAAEQIVAQELRIVLDRNYRNEQYFWVRDKKGATAEIDFVWQHNATIVPIEVKSGTNAHLRSLHSFMDTTEATGIAVRIWPGKYSIDEVTTPNGKTFRLINLPFYYIGMLDKILDKNL